MSYDSTSCRSCTVRCRSSCQDCKHKRTKHHRKCVINGGTSEPKNISKVPKNHHDAFHTLFYSMEAPMIASQLTQHWIDPEWRIVAVRRET